MWTSQDTADFNNRRCSCILQKLPSVSRISLDNTVTLPCNDVGVANHPTTMDGSSDPCVLEELSPPIAVPLTKDVSSLKITNLLPAYCYQDACHGNHPSIMAGQRQSWKTHRQLLPSSQPVDICGVGGYGKLCSSQPAESHVLLTTKTLTGMEKKSLHEQDSDKETEIASQPLTVSPGGDSAKLSLLYATDKACNERKESKQLQEAFLNGLKCAPEGCISENVTDCPKGHTPKCLTDCRKGSISECVTDCREGNILECAADCSKGNFPENITCSPNGNISECVTDCPEGSISEFATDFPQGNTSECAADLPEGNIPACVTDCLKGSISEFAIDCYQSNTSECTADLPEGNIPECVTDSLEGSVSEFVVDCSQSNTLECAASNIPERVTDYPEASISEFAADCAQGNTSKCVEDCPKDVILTVLFHQNSLPVSNTLSQKISTIQSVPETNIQTISQPSTTHSVVKKWQHSSHSKFGTFNLNCFSTQPAQVLSSNFVLCASKPLRISSLRSFWKTSFDDNKMGIPGYPAIITLIKQLLVVSQVPNLVNPSSTLSIVEPAPKKRRMEEGTVPVLTVGDDSPGSPFSSSTLEKEISDEHTCDLSSLKLFPNSPVQLATADGAKSITQAQPMESGGGDDHAVVPLCSNSCREHRQDDNNSANDRVCLVRSSCTPDSMHIPGMGLLCEEVVCKTPTKSAASSAMTATVTTQTATPPPSNSDAQLVPPSPLLHVCPTLLISEDAAASMYNHPPVTCKTHPCLSEAECDRAVVPETVIEELECGQSVLLDRRVPVWTCRPFSTDHIGHFIPESVQHPSRYNLSRPRIRLGLSRRQRCKRLHPSYQPRPQ